MWLLTARLCNLKLVHVSQNTHQITGSCAGAFSCLTLLARTSKSQLSWRRKPTAEHSAGKTKKHSSSSGPFIRLRVCLTPVCSSYGGRLVFFLASPSCLIMSAEEHAAGANLQHLSATACLAFCRMSHQQEAVINVQRHLLDPTSISSALKRIELNQQTQEKPLNY